LAEARQANRAFAAQPAQALLIHFHIRQVHAGDAATSNLEDQRRFQIEAAVPGDGGNIVVLNRARLRRTSLIVHAHARTSFSAGSTAAKSSSVLVSVAATIRRSRAAASCGIRRDAGTPARTPFCAKASTIGAAALGSFKVNSLKNAGVTSSTPGTRARRS